jgi:hypothetical protein
LRPERFVDDFAGGRRQVPRCEARLKVSLCFGLSPPTGQACEAAPDEARKVIGETLNLSETGLALALTSSQINGSYLNLVGHTLQLTLELPAGTVQIRATPKWCQWSEDEGSARQLLLGLRIAEMNDEEWVLLVRYVHACL